MADGDALHCIGSAKRIGDGAAIVVVDADHGGAVRRQPIENASLDGGVVLDRAVAIEMVRRDVEECRGIGGKRRS